MMVAANNPADPSPEPRGLACTRCGCRDLRVRDTRPHHGFIVRVRVCRNCGNKMHSRERIEGSAN